MVDGIGVCTICAKVCHADCDVTYSKFGSFFCDCGAKEDGSCRAMTKRTPASNGASASGQSKSNNSGFAYEQLLPSSLRRKNETLSNSGNENDKNGQSMKKDVMLLKRRKMLAQKISPWKGAFLDIIQHAAFVQDLTQLMYSLMPVLDANSDRYSSVGRFAKVQENLKTLHSLEPKNLEHTEQLMLPTLGSQEGAFENVRMNYTGDQGQTIRQLMNNHMIRRVIMCCLSSGPSGRRQHLAVAHERGKITVLQLSALLKQADSNQKKLTLTRLASAPVPFTVLSILSSPANEDYLAVTGLKDCHVLKFGNSGSVQDHLVLHPQLDANNFIIKTLWMPSSQTELALVTADFVKVYDLSKDTLSPQYCFLVPSGKVRDCTLAYMDDGTRYVLIMSSAGHIYYQSLTDESSASRGPFYVTSIMDVDHNELKVQQTSGQVGNGGASIFYYHALQLLFFSYSQGKNFVASLKQVTDELKGVQKITVKSTPPNGGGSSSNANNKSNIANQPLCQWGEVPGHPGNV